MLPTEFARLSVPSVNVKVLFEYVVLSTTLSPPVLAQPSEPFPPLPEPGCPEPLYCVEQFNQPLAPEELSIHVPGIAINMPDTLPDIVIENCDTGVLLNANV